MNDQNSPNIPKIPLNSFRITLELKQSGLRLDSQLMEALRLQDENSKLKIITRSEFKKLFKDKKILIKGQPAKPASEIAAGITYVDILLA
jgi:hypothetical protein